MSEQNKSISIEEYIGMKRQNLILSLENSKEQTLRTFDDLTQLIAQQQKQLKELNDKLPKDPKNKESEHDGQAKPVVKVDTKDKKK